MGKLIYGMTSINIHIAEIAMLFAIESVVSSDFRPLMKNTVVQTNTTLPIISARTPEVFISRVVTNTKIVDHINMGINSVNAHSPERPTSCKRLTADDNAGMISSRLTIARPLTNDAIIVIIVLTR